MNLQPEATPAASTFAGDPQLAPSLGMAFPHLEGSVEAHVSKRVRVALWALCGIITLSPLLWVRVPPLVDYPNHLARMWILVHGAEIPELAANYAVHWRILPDLAMDLVVSALSRVMPVEESGLAFVGLTMLALIGGTLTLHRVLHGRLEVWPVCSVLFVYNAALFWGFLNCLFATGIYLFAFSGWIATRHWRPGPRLLTFSAVASLLLVLHLFAFGLYGLSVALYELANRTTGGRRLTLGSLVEWCTVCLQFVPGIMLWYASLERSGSTATSYGDLVFKLYALISPFTFGVQPTALDLLTASVAILFFAFAIRTGSLKIVREMRLPLAVMILVVLLVPHRLSGALFADIRLPVALPFVIIASTRLEASRKEAILSFAAAGSLVLGLRVWTVTEAWRDYDRWFTEFREASAVIPPRARLLVVEAPLSGQEQLPGVPAPLAKLESFPFIHLGALAVMDRAAFFPYLFTGWTPIDVTPPNEALSQRQAVPATPEELAKSADPDEAKTLYTGPNFLGEQPYWRNWPATFDFVLWMDFSGAPKPQLKQLRLLTSGSFFDIYRVVRP
jgi:hypothetical protein